MSQKVNIPPQNQPFRRQASIGGNVSFRNIGDNEDNSFITLAKVTRVYYQQGKLDFKLTNTNSLVADQSGNGSGSAPIPVDFFGRRPNGKVFGHYRPIKVGNLIAVAYVNGHKASPIVIGVYPNSGQDYEIISPSLYLDGDDNDSGVAETALAEQKIYPSMQLEYRSGSGAIAKALNGHSFLVVDDETSVQYSKLWQNYETVGFFHSNSDDINPLKETAGDWLLVHEDNPLSDEGDNHRTRFFVNKKGEIQIVLMDNTSSGTISVLDGSKDNGFTISQYYDLTKTKSGDLSDDVYEPDFNSATNYVSLNIGKDQEIALEVAADNSSKLELKSDGLYLNGEPFSETLNAKLDNLADDIRNNIHTSPDFQELANEVENNAEEASEAATSAQQAGEDAKQAGLAAEAAGTDAENIGNDIKNRIIYYASISNEQDVAIPGKYIIVNTDTYIANGTIKNAYIEDGAIDNAKIANGAIGTAQIEDAAITRGKIANAAIGSAQIENAAITDAQVGSLSFDHMIGATLDASKINVINLTADNIEAHSISADILNIGQLSDITDNAGEISKGTIQAGDNGVQITGLDADDPNKYTPAKKAILLSEVDRLNSAAGAIEDYCTDTSNTCPDVDEAKQDMDNGLASLLADMTTTTEFDYNTVINLEQTLQEAIDDFYKQVNERIGKTANGKNSIYRGTDEPQNPSINDIWIEPLADGTQSILVWDGGEWINSGLADMQAVSNSLSGLPKSYYQSDPPEGDNVHDGDTWYNLTSSSDGKSYIYVVQRRENGSWIPLLNSGEVSNLSSINALESNALMRGTNYGGVTFDDNGVTLKSGDTNVYLNGTNGFQIQRGSQDSNGNTNIEDIFHVDNSGNLTMQGSITGGNISGVNFTGNNLTLENDLEVNGGQILLNNGTTTLATLSSNGLSIKDGGLSIIDSQGNQTTYVDNDGTFTTTKGVFTGNVTANSLTIPAGSTADINVAGEFMVDSQGNVTANSFTSTNAKINGGTIDFSQVTAENLNADSINTGTLTADRIYGGTLDVSSMKVTNFSADNIDGGTLEGISLASIEEDKGEDSLGNTTDDFRYVKIANGSIFMGTLDENDESLININDYVTYTPDPINRILITPTSSGGLDSYGDTFGFNTSWSNSPNGGLRQSAFYVSRQDALDYPIFLGTSTFEEPGHKNEENNYGLSINGKSILINLDGEGTDSSTFSVQKDNHIGVYIGGGDSGSDLQIAGSGVIQFQGNRWIDDGFNDAVTNTLGNLQVDNLHVRKWLGVDSNKNAIVKTSQGTVAINAYETAEYYFGDLGEGQTDSSGVAYIGIEKLFNETVNTDIPYQVFLTAYGPGNLWVAQREPDRFVIKSEQPNIKFGWEIKAKRKGYEDIRLQNVDDKLNHMEATS